MGMVELQRRLTTPGVGEVLQSEDADLSRRRTRNFENVFGNPSPDYLPFEFKTPEVALEAACTFLDTQGTGSGLGRFGFTSQSPAMGGADFFSSLGNQQHQFDSFKK